MATVTKRRTIGPMATELGISVETIRFYERRRLIRQPARFTGSFDITETTSRQ